MPANAAGWRLRPIPSFHGYAVEWADAQRLLLSRGRHLFEATGLAQSPTRVLRFPTNLATAALTRVRLTQRALRLVYYNAMPVGPARHFLNFGKSLAVADQGRVEPLAGLRSSFRTLRGGCAVDGSGTAYFGEYRFVRSGREVCVYALPQGSRQVEVVHTFPAGQVHHVHGVYRNPEDNALWCATGDIGEECGLYRSDDGFRTLVRIGGGDETWRAVSLRFRGGYVYYGTDAEFVHNRLYRLDPASGVRDELVRVDGPVFYSAEVDGALLFGVTVERCPIQIGRRATLWAVDADDSVQALASFDKDFLHKRYFMLGTLQFPAGPGDGSGTYLSAIGLRGIGRCVLHVSRGESEIAR